MRMPQARRLLFCADLGGWPLHPSRNDDLLGDLLVDRYHVIVPRAKMKLTNHRRIAAAQHAQYLAFRPAIFLAAAELDQHLVSVHRRTNCLRTDVNVALNRAALACVGNDEPVPVAMHGQPPRNQVLVCRGMFRQRKTVTARLDQAADFHQRLQAFCELPALVAPDAHLANQLLVSRRAVRLSFDVAKNGLVANHEVEFVSGSSPGTPLWVRKCEPVPSQVLIECKNPQRRFAFVWNSLYGSNNCSAGRQCGPVRSKLSLAAVIQQFPTTDSGVAVRPKSSTCKRSNTPERNLAPCGSPRTNPTSHQPQALNRSAATRLPLPRRPSRAGRPR